MQQNLLKLLSTCFAALVLMTAASSSADASANCAWRPSADGPPIGFIAKDICNAVDQKTKVKARFTLVGIYFAAERDGECVQARYARGENDSARKPNRDHWNLLPDLPGDNRHPNGDTPCKRSGELAAKEDFIGEVKNSDLLGRIAEMGTIVLDDVHGDVDLIDFSEAVLIFRRVGKGGPNDAWRTIVLRISQTKDFRGPRWVWQADFAAPQKEELEAAGVVMPEWTDNSQFRDYLITEPGANPPRDRRIKLWIRHLVGGTPVMETFSRRCRGQNNRNATLELARLHFAEDEHHEVPRNICNCDESDGRCPDPINLPPSQ